MYGHSFKQYSDVRHASENPLQRKRCEAGGRQPETTTGFDIGRGNGGLFGRFSRRSRVLVDPGVSQIQHLDHKRQVFTSEGR